MRSRRAKSRDRVLPTSALRRELRRRRLTSACSRSPFSSWWRQTRRSSRACRRGARHASLARATASARRRRQRRTRAQACALAGARAAPRRGSGVGGRRRALAADAVGDPQPLAAAAAAARGAQGGDRQPDAVRGWRPLLGEHGGDDGGDLQVPAHRLGDRLDRRRPRPGDHLPDGAGPRSATRGSRCATRSTTCSTSPRSRRSRRWRTRCSRSRRRSSPPA